MSKVDGGASEKIAGAVRQWQDGYDDGKRESMVEIGRLKAELAARMPYQWVMTCDGQRYEFMGVSTIVPDGQALPKHEMLKQNALSASPGDTVPERARVPIEPRRPGPEPGSDKWLSDWSKGT